MNKLTIALTALVALSIFSEAHAQYVPGAIPAGMDRRKLFPGTGTGGSNVGRNDNTKAESEKDKEKKHRKKQADDAGKNLHDKKDKLNDYTDRMKRDNDSRGMAPYLPGWVREKEGRRVDETYNRLKSERDAADRKKQTADELYKSVR